MKNRWFLILALIFITTVSMSAQQTRTITNEDLEKYRQKRVAAERDLRENYERLGFPSPEELEKQIEQSRRERSALAARLEAENLQREILNIERQRVSNEARLEIYQTSADSFQSSGGGYYNSASGGFYGFSNYGFPNNRYHQRYRGGFGGGFRRNYGGQPRYEYRNNLPVRVQPPPQRILAPR